MGRKSFYTERDIEALAAQGTTSLPLNDDTVYTELALEKARELGITFIKRTSPAPQQTPADAELVARIKAAVMSKLGDSVSEAVVDSAIDHVLKSLS